MCFVAEDLSELSQNPQFPAFSQLVQILRQLIQQNPDQLQTLMQTLQRIQPDLYQVNLQSNLDAFNFPSAFSLN